MATVGGKSQLITTLFQTFAPGLLNSYNIPASLNQVLNYASGTGAGAFDQLHSKIYSLATSTPQDIDLTAIVDVGGSTVNMARVREWFAFNLSRTTGQILTQDTTVSNGFKVFGDGTSGAKLRAWPAISAVNAFNYLHWSDYYSVGSGVGGVTSGTSKVVRLDPGAAAFDVWVVALGCSAVS